MILRIKALTKVRYGAKYRAKVSHGCKGFVLTLHEDGVWRYFDRGVETEVINTVWIQKLGAAIKALEAGAFVPSS